MIEIFKLLQKYKITPNQYYMLISMKEGVSSPGINESMELRSLIFIGMVSQSNQITDIAFEIIDEIEAMVKLTKKKVTKDLLGIDGSDNIDKYREMWDMGMLPSSKPARDSKKVLEQKFTWFFQNYNYTWDIILKATAYYIDEYEKKSTPFIYMRTSSYFINKSTSDKIKESDLANYCDLILSGDHLLLNNKFNDKVV